MNHTQNHRKSVIGILILFLFLAFSVQNADALQQMKQYCVNPPFVSDTAPPLVMVIMSKDHKQFYKAYNDLLDLNEDGVIDNTYNDAIDYYGYFDPNKCYTYTASDDYFSPSVAATGAHNHYCTSKWSGNFLNWAAMARMDVMRKVLYGGSRSKDLSTSTVLTRAVIPNDAHAWAKAYNGSDISSLTPFSWTGITLCNLNEGDPPGNSASNQSKIYAIKGYYPYAASLDSKQCTKTNQGGTTLTSDGENATPTVDAHYAWFYADVKVCDSAIGLESNCQIYCQGAGCTAPNYKPAGLMQKYGVNRHESDDTSDDTTQMLFGLISGSFSENFNDKGGVLRSNLKDVTTQVGNANGFLDSNSAFLGNIVKFKVVDNSYSGSYTYNTSWENPVGEMFYEAVRFFMGKATPSTTFDTSQSDQRYNSMTKDSWDNPFTSKPPCSKPFVLILSDLSPSYDSDELPGAYSTTNWTVTTPSPNDTGLNVQTLIANSGINAIENPTKAFIGQYESTYDRDCTPKPSSGTFDFGHIRGLCIDEPTRQGSYYIAGLAHYAHTNDLNPASGNQKLNTYVVATSAPVPELEFTVNGNPVKILPIFHDGCPINNTTRYPDCDLQGKGGDNSKGQIVDFKLLMTPTVSCPSGDTDCTTEQTTNGYQYGYEIMWDDCEAGCDHDLDIQYRIYVKISGSNITVKTKGVYASAGHMGYGGYIITGVGATDSGEYYELACGGGSGSGSACGSGSTACTNYSPPAGTTDCDPYNNIRNTDSTINEYVERTFTSSAGSGATLLKSPLLYAAKYGGFVDGNASNTPDVTTEWDKDGDGNPDTYFYAANPLKLEAELEKALTDILRRATSGTAASVLASGEGSGANIVQAIFYPKRAFYSDKEVLWTGTLQNLWFYIDPKTQNSTIRENTQETVAATNKELNLDLDYIINYKFDPNDQKLKAELFADANGDGVQDSVTPSSTILAENLKYLWEAGLVLWNRDVTKGSGTRAKRKIYTSISTSPTFSLLSGNFSEDTNNSDLDNAATLLPYLALPTTDTTDDAETTYKDGDFNHDGLVDVNDARILIRYIHGEDTADINSTYSWLRSRSVAIDLNTDGDISDTVTVNGISMTETSKAWKLGDIVNSTPKIVSWIPLNKYDISYGDTTYTSYLASDAYKYRGKVISGTGYGSGMVFAGANDGMLHAFKLGTFEVVNDGTKIKAKLGGSDNGKEEWTFIPKSVLPYLRYQTISDYCHIYSIDLTPTVFDASINIDTTLAGQIANCTNPAYSNYWECKKSANSWRTILIGGMRYGGACNDACPGSATDPNCIQTPEAGKGFSSYFALDITDPSTPMLLWEFTHPQLGLSSSGPAMIKIQARQDDGATSSTLTDRNGRWFVLFTSGPTGYIDTSTHQFTGHSSQNLKLFVLDLKTGILATTDGAGVAAPIDTGITNAFGGSLKDATIDFDLDYQDNALYFGYTKLESSKTIKTGEWLDGGVLRLITREDLSSGDLTAYGVSGDTALNPNNWRVTKVIEGIGPVTSAVSHLVHYPTGSTNPDKAFLFFGTGRYYFKTATGVDDAQSQRRIFGINEPCLTKIKGIVNSASPVCIDGPAVTDTVCSGTTNEKNALGCLGDATSSSSGSSDTDGWYIYLNTCTQSDGLTEVSCADSTAKFYYERVITDPLATFIGQVFYTTYAPSSDVCEYGGKSYLWAVKYDTGGTVAGTLKGKGYIQLSTGEIQAIDFKSMFTEEGGRKTAGMAGVPPAGSGLSVVVPPKPIDQIMHIRKK